MLWALLSLSIVSALTFFSYRRLLAVRELECWAAPYLARTAKTDVGEGLGARSRDAERARVADLNEATIELGYRLGEPGFVPRACAKAALSVGAFVALVQAAQLLSGADTRAWSGPLLSFVGGCIGAVVCSLIGRAAEVEARRLRDEWRTLIRQSRQDVPT